MDLFSLIQFMSECGTAQLRLSLCFLCSCYSRCCHWRGWSQQYFAFVELIILNLNDDQSEARLKWRDTHSDWHSEWVTQWQRSWHNDDRGPPGSGRKNMPLSLKIFGSRAKTKFWCWPLILLIRYLKMGFFSIRRATKIKGRHRECYLFFFMQL